MSQQPPLEERLRALCDVSRAITTSLARDEVLELICAQAARLLDAESVLITVLPREDGTGAAPSHLEVI